MKPSKEVFFVALILLISLIFSYEGSGAEEPLELTAVPVFSLDGLEVDFSFSPKLLAADRSRNEIYIVDSSGRNVSIYDNEGRYLYWFTLEKAPVGLAIGNDGSIYVAQNDRISILNYRGERKRELDLSIIPDFKSISIQSLHIGKDNRIYIGDVKNGRVIVLEVKNGKEKFLYQFGKKGKEEGRIFNLSRLATDHERVYILDPPLFKISVFTKKGKFLFRFGLVSGLEGGFSQPVGIDADERMIYVIDVNRMVAIVFDREGEFLFEIGGEESGKQFLWPGDILVDNQGKIYVADSGNRKVRVFRVSSEKEDNEGER